MSFVPAFLDMNLYFFACKKWASRYVTQGRKDDVISQKNLERNILDKAGKGI